MTTPQESTEPEAPPSPEATETLGNLLRRTRQDKRVAIEVAAKETRIHATTLKALEEDNRNELPAEVFTRGFVKIYAQYLGLDPDQALRLYLDHRGEKTAIPDEKINAQEVLAGETMAEAPAFHAERHLFTAAVVILITLILYLGYKITAPPPPQEPPAPVQISEPLPQQTLPPAQDTVPPPEEIAQQAPPPTENLPAPLTAANPQGAPAAISPPLAQPAAPPVQALPAPPATIPTVPATPAKIAKVEPVAPPKPAAPLAVAPVTTPRQATPAPPAPLAAPAATPRQTVPPTPQATQPQAPVPPVKVAPATQSTPLPLKTTPPAAPPAMTPAMTPATAATKPPLKELAPAGPIKKEKIDKGAATTPVVQAEKPAKEPSTAEKLIAAIKPLKPPYALEATFREDTWVRVQVDGEKPKPQYFRAGEKSSWQANSKMQLFIGNAGGVDLVLNNTKLPPLGKPGNTTRISIQPQSDQR